MNSQIYFANIYILYAAITYMPTCKHSYCVGTHKPNQNAYKYWASKQASINKALIKGLFYMTNLLAAHNIFPSIIVSRK